MSLLERVRAAVAGYGPLTEVEMFGGVVVDWDGDPFVGVVDDEVIVRVPGGGWEPATGDLQDAVNRAAGVVLAECVVRWHEQLREQGDDSYRAMLALTQHDPEREQLQRTLLGLLRHPKLGQLAFTCLGHLARYDGEVLPEVVPRLKELLDDPELGVFADEALWDVEVNTNPFLLWRHSLPWVIFAPPGDQEVARQLPLAEAAGAVVVVVPHAEALPSLREYVRDLCQEVEDRTHTADEDGNLLVDPNKPPFHYVLEYDGDIAALQPLLHDQEDLVAVFKAPYLEVW
ncbi:hypothetical protein LFM09_02725 [Lentzea alba]|uniref:hypothetical protein n=1 Tax=Lentzea alba TaxID=2714351 RepID=UPI0039BFF87F